MKHKHADLIHAWADGAVIEARAHDTDWFISEQPHWDSNVWEYRIKPEEKKPVVRWLWADPSGIMSANLYAEDERDEIPKGYTIKLEWSRTEFPE